MEFSQEEFDEILNIFSEESQEILQRLNNNLLSLEKDPKNLDLILDLFRDAHSLKGAARMIGFENIQDIAHKIEDILGLAKENSLIINPFIFDKILKSLDFCEILIKQAIENKKELSNSQIDDYINELQKIINGDLFETTQLVESNEPTKLIDKNKIDIEKFNEITNEIFEILKSIANSENQEEMIELKTKVDFLFLMFENTEFYKTKNDILDIKFKTDICLKTSSFLLNEEILNFEKILKIIGEDVKKAISETYVPKIFDDSQNIRTKLNQILIILNSFEQNSENINIFKSELQKLENEIENIEIKNLFKKIIELVDKSLKANKPIEELMINNFVDIIENIAIFSDTQVQEKPDLSLVLENLKVIEQMLDLPEISSIKADAVQKTKELLSTFDKQMITTMRVHTSKLDFLINQVSEFIINKMKIKNHLTEITKITDFIQDWKYLMQKNIRYMRYFDKKMFSEKNSDKQFLINYNKHLQNLIYENNSKIIDLKLQMDLIKIEVQNFTQKFELSIGEFESVIKNIRILPLNTIFSLFPRMIRDLSYQTGKQIELEVEGGELEIDKKIIEEIKSPLMHIMRNSIDHGIELPDIRIKNGKKPTGKIRIKSEKILNTIRLTIQDDGFGIDLTKIKEKALRNGLLTDFEISNMTDEQIINLIFFPGFSTEEKITEISGRGIGLDVVQSKLNQLNGKIKVLSVLGKGTNIILDIPISMTTFDAFIIEVDSIKYAIDAHYVKTILKINVDKIIVRDNKQYILLNDEKIDVFFLNEILKPNSKANRFIDVKLLIVEYDGGKIAFIIDEIAGHDEIIPKELAAPLFKLKYISGASILQTGETCLILNISEIYKTVFNFAKNYYKPCKTLISEINRNNEYTIMIVDDSKTSRIMLNNILKSNNFNTIAVEDPLDVINLLKINKVDLIISDVEMPNMNGFELCQNIKNNYETREIPVVIFSSLEKEEYSKKAKDAGADEYIQKTTFKNKMFIDIIYKFTSNITKNK